MTALSKSIDKEKLKVINIVLLLFNFIIVYLLILLLNLLNLSQLTKNFRRRKIFLNLLLFQKSLSLLRIYFTIHDRSYSQF